MLLMKIFLFLSMITNLVFATQNLSQIPQKTLMFESAPILYTNFNIIIPEKIVLPGIFKISAQLGNNKSAIVNFTLPPNYAVLNQTSKTSIGKPLKTTKSFVFKRTVTCNLTRLQPICNIQLSSNAYNSETIFYEAIINDLLDNKHKLNNNVKPLVIAPSKTWKYLGGQSFIRTYNQDTIPQIAITTNEDVYLGLNNINGNKELALYYLNNNDWNLLNTINFEQQLLPITVNNIGGQYAGFKYLMASGNNIYLAKSDFSSESNLERTLVYQVYNLNQNVWNKISSINSTIPESQIKSFIPRSETMQSGLFSINGVPYLDLPVINCTINNKYLTCNYVGTGLYDINGSLQNFINRTGSGSIYPNDFLILSSSNKNVYYLATRTNPLILYSAIVGNNNPFGIVNDLIDNWNVASFTYGAAWNNLLLYPIYSGGGAHVLTYDIQSNKWDYLTTKDSYGGIGNLYVCGNNLYSIAAYSDVDNKTYASLWSYDLTQGLNSFWQMVGGYGFSQGLNYFVNFGNNCTPYIAYLDSNDFTSVSVVSYQ